jgi:raffinose/stachyose/melibiose transport system substrate-binding protein
MKRIGLTRLAVLFGFPLTVSALVLTQAQTQQTLRVIMPGGPDQFAVVQKLNDQFTKETGVRVEFQGVPTDQYYPVINTRLVGGDAPDVIGAAGIDSARQWLKAGYIADLSGEAWVKNVVQANRTDVTLGTDKAYQFVVENVGVGLFYNRTMLEAAGATVPENYPQFLAAMARVKAAGKTPLVVGAKDGWGPQMAVFLNAVNTIYRTNPNADADMLAGRLKFDSAAWRSVHQRVADWAKASYFNPQIALGLGDFDPAVAEFSAGRAAFIVHGSWNLGSMKDLKFKYGFTAFPGGPAGTKGRGIILSGMNFSVNAKARSVPVAKQYLAFWSRNVDTYLRETGGRFGSLTTSKIDEEALRDFATAVADNRANDYFPSNWGEASKVQEIWKKAMQNILLGQPVAAQMKLLDADFAKYKR